MSDRQISQTTTIAFCETDEDKAAVIAATRMRSVRVVKTEESVCSIVDRECVVDPNLKFFSTIIMVLRDADLRDRIAMRVGDEKCRWVDWQTINWSDLGSIKTAIDNARPMWTDEVCLMSDVPEAAQTLTYESGFPLLDEHGFRIVRPAFMPCVGPYGPLPGSAEFHTRDGWKRLDQWADGDEALVYNFDTGTTKYEAAGRVVADAPDGFMKLSNDGTIDIVACNSHRWPVVGKSGAKKVFTTSELAHAGVAKHGSGYSLIRTFTAPELPDLPISDDELRLRVATCADGHIRSRMTMHRICVCIRKERKKQRLAELLDRLGRTYRVRNYDGRPTEFHFDFDGHEDKQLAQFRNASQRQLKIVFDELKHWDGHVYENSGIGRLVVSTSNPDDASFLEYLFSACGQRASVFVQNASPERQRDNYLVCANGRGRLGRVQWSSVGRVPSEDGKKYCLTTSTGFFVCRLSPGQVFVTGNSGKSVLMRQLCCNLYRMYGWRTLLTSFEEKIKPRYQRDLRKHFIGEEFYDHQGQARWRNKSTEWTAAEVADADKRIEDAFRFLRRKRNATLDADRLLDRIEFAVKVYGVDVVVIDPVNEIDHQVGKGESKTDYMGRFIMRLKQMADDYSLLMIVCAHPPKEGVEKRSSKGRLMTLNDAADTAHFGNKADIGWCVWRPGLTENSPTYLHIDKLKDHDVMGKPTAAKLVLNRLDGAFVVTKVGYEDVVSELVGENSQ